MVTQKPSRADQRCDFSLPVSDQTSTDRWL